MTRKKMVHWLVLAGLAVVMGCGGKYADVIDANRQFTAAMENFSAAMETVKNADGAAAALNDLAAAMAPLMPKMKELSEKYPELQNQGKLPEKLAKMQDETKAAGQKFSQSMMRLMPYMQNPAVQQAQMRVARAMGQMGGR